MAPMAARSTPSDDPTTEDLSDLNARIAEEAAAATTAEARSRDRHPATAGLKDVKTSDVS